MASSRFANQPDGAAQFPLRGIEGAAGATYFKGFTALFPSPI